MADSENTYFQRFNDSIVPASASTPNWGAVQRASSQLAGGANVGISRQSRPYWITDLSGCIMNVHQRDVLLAMLWRNKGPIRPVLMRISVFCEIGSQLDVDAQGYAVILPEPIGTGTGVSATFQLRKRLLVPGYETEFVYYKVTKPEIDYPAMQGIARTTGGPTEWAPMPELQIWRNGVELSRDHWTVDRNTGLVTTDGTGTIAATGGFYVVMLMPAQIPISRDPDHVGQFVIKNGVHLEEPPGADDIIPE